ncbi:MAG TPA: hypothetical protein V6D19_16925, partial [Stenomitos sp.]
MKVRLLTLSALVVAGTLNSALLGGATSVVVGLASNIVAADLQSLWDRVARQIQARIQGQNAEHCEGLSDVVGTAIAAV